ncbi:hypothetical protein L195_g026789 [Trifolium pratense]|uniref:Uncharacterized protein n=1 Tax=Trifolium pratense TaxID=57577 RepID=A0A2K3NK91_TRIPR|nr:hypothetical protein L195_g026789 [Trifolium pratense]
MDNERTMSIEMVIKSYNYGASKDVIWKLKSMNTVSLPSNDGLSVEKGAILVTEFYPLFSRLLIPMHLFLKKDMVVLLLKVTFNKDMVQGVNSF